MGRQRKLHKTVQLREEEKWMIISLWQRRRSIRAIAKELGRSREAVARWIQRYKATASVTPLKSVGRHAVLSPETCVMALNMLTRHERPSAGEVALELKTCGALSKVVSKSTVLRHAHAAAKASGHKLKCYNGPPLKGLTEATKQKRLAFALADMDTDWSQVMFTDRKRFYFKHPGQGVKRCGMYLQSERRDHEGAYRPSKPSCLNIYAGITMWGATDVVEVAGTTGYKHCYTTKRGKPALNVTSGQYIDVLQEVFLPQGHTKFMGGDWVLQQDNDPTHAVARAVIGQWKHDRGHDVQLLLDWPPNSPDLNLIENFWNFVQMDVEKKALSSFTEFKNCVKSLIASDEPTMKSYLVNLYASMPKRLAKVIELGGGRTSY